MTTTMTTTARRILAALMTVGALSVAAPGIAHAGESCHTIDARGTGQQTGPTTTVATIRGGGLLTGRTVGDFPDAVPTDGGLLIAGTVTFTGGGATLAVDVEGTLTFTDPPGSLTFDVTSTDMAGTGRLAGVDSGVSHLRLAGVGAPDGSFTETVTGEICIGHPPR
ncbi:hypothetical protein [Pseudonocardia abyssalis]|uniref:Uncharacterized protein n=1 Tax=Pseudonocardia abyssalis TaxID=2792008 RepID=A0ABS6UQ86_9PSEU|nr:hypothetical protein [Pseudonocardia abyssalis]MBW0118982.1 hypothetical protein [Pseudonocardia abyssalis]MBW0134423.1 hypothetical protein [Pseudonocardia abyssalis]